MPFSTPSLLFPRYRLNISKDLSQSEVKVTPRKRKRDDDGSSFIQESKSTSGFSTSSQTSGPLEISEVSADGRYVKIKNVSSKVRRCCLMFQHENMTHDTLYQAMQPT